jgi:hypothetical protein
LDNMTIRSKSGDATPHTTARGPAHATSPATPQATSHAPSHGNPQATSHATSQATSHATSHATSQGASHAAAAPKASAQARIVRLGSGLLITGLPLLLWMLWSFTLGSDFIQRHAWRWGLAPVQIYVWLLIAAGLLQLVAVFVLRKSDQKPRDWISIVSLIDAALSIALTIFFWMQISALIFHTT